jgi:ATP-dependent DNA helicase PIF1
LRVAYAITIHKAQGASLDSALVDVGPSTFEYGQAYVALSRVRSLESLFVFEIAPKAFRAHPAVKAFYAGLK